MPAVTEKDYGACVSLSISGVCAVDVFGFKLNARLREDGEMDERASRRRQKTKRGHSENNVSVFHTQTTPAIRFEYATWSGPVL